jgi:hypothetical protein
LLIGAGNYRSVDSEAIPIGRTDSVADSVITVRDSPPIGLPGVRERSPGYPYLDPDDLLFALADLFASDAKMAQEVFDLGAAERAKGKRFAAFHYLFVDASGPALGAKYTVCGYRCRIPEEGQAARRALLGNQVLEGGHGAS